MRGGRRERQGKKVSKWERESTGEREGGRKGGGKCEKTDRKGGREGGREGGRGAYISSTSHFHVLYMYMYMNPSCPHFSCTFVHLQLL